MIVVAFGLCPFGGNIHAAQGPDIKPEKTRLEVAIAATGPLYLPILLANEAGYFSKRGLTVNISTLSATASAQALLSGQVDIYQGGTATIHANVAGSDLIYIAASVDRSTLCCSDKRMTTFETCAASRWRRLPSAPSARSPCARPPKSAAWRSQGHQAPLPQRSAGRPLHISRRQRRRRDHHAAAD